MLWGRAVTRASSTIVRCGLILPALLLLASCSKSPDDYIASGNKFFQQKKYDQAIVQYQNAVKVAPKRGDVRVKLAESYRETNQVGRAAGEYIRAADLLPNDTNLQMIAIRAFLTSNRFEDAKTRAELVLQKDPRNAAAQGLLGSALIGLRDMDGALKQVEEAVRISPTGSGLQIKLGAIKVSQGDVLAAEDAFKRAAALDPQSLNAQLLLANFEWWNGNLPLAEEQFQKALQVAPTDPLATRAAAMFFITTGRPEKAEPYLIALTKSGADPANHILLADYYLSRKDRDKAIAVLSALKDDNGAQWRLASLRYTDGRTAEAHQIVDAVIRRDPNDSGALLVKADFLEKEHKLDEALARAKAAALADPRLASAQFALGKIYREMNRLDEAIQAFNESIRLNPNATAAQVALADAHLVQNNAAKSIEYARDALKGDPRSIAARITLIASLVSQGRGQEAEAELKPLVARYPESAPVHAYMGAAQLLNGNQAAARQSFERALAIDKTSSEALAGLISIDLGAKRIAEARAKVEQYLPSTDAAVLVLAAQVYGAAGDAPKVESSLLKAIELDSSNMRAYEMLGRYYVSIKRLDAAREQFERLLARQPKNISAHTMVALLLSAQNKQDEARARFERILEIDPRAAIAANNLAWIYADGAGSLDRALELAQTAKSVLPDDPSVNDTLGWVYYRKNLAATAIPLLQSSIDKDGRQPIYHYHLGLAYAKTGDKTKARASLEQAIKLSPNFPGSEDARRVLDSF